MSRTRTSKAATKATAESEKAPAPGADEAVTPVVEEAPAVAPEAIKIDGTVEETAAPIGDGEQVAADLDGTVGPIETDALEPARYTVRAVSPRGFWRAGRFWSPDPTPAHRSDFSDDQWAALEAEPQLVVTPE